VHALHACRWVDRVWNDLTKHEFMPGWQAQPELLMANLVVRCIGVCACVQAAPAGPTGDLQLPPKPISDEDYDAIYN
jgi:hypothetical protein